MIHMYILYITSFQKFALKNQNNKNILVSRHWYFYMTSKLHNIRDNDATWANDTCENVSAAISGTSESINRNGFQIAHDLCVHDDTRRRLVDEFGA